MKTVRLKRNLGVWIEGQKLAVVEEKPEGLTLSGPAIFSLRGAGAVATAGPVSRDDVEVVE